MSCCGTKNSCNGSANSNPFGGIDTGILPKEDQAVKEAVRKAYAGVAVTNGTGESYGIPESCCGTGPSDDDYTKVLGYSEDEINSVKGLDGANMGLGCGNPVAIASLNPGETVIDLGSGGGFDCFLAARKVGPTGHVIGVDMTPEMIGKARRNAAKGKYANYVEFRLGEIEHLPVGDGVADVIISNCVLNLSTDKAQVLREAARVLKSGGRFAISDVIATSELPEKLKNDLALYSGCMAGATPIDTLKSSLTEAGFKDITITVKEDSKKFIEKWGAYSTVENYVAAANINAVKI